MDWLNYHHLFYFWTVAREGSIARACEVLHLAQPTISGQIRDLENALKAKLFDKQGRYLVLTDIGRVVYRYAEEIFSLGRELQDVVQGRPTGHPLRFVVGVAETMPKRIVHRLLEPALKLPDPIQLIVQDGKPEPLFAQLALHDFDLVLADLPVSPMVRIRAYNHLLGECGISILACPKLARRYRKNFPQSLNEAPFLLPLENTPLRRSLDLWLEDQKIRPLIRGEFADSALLKVFGQMELGLFAAPSVVEEEICRQYHVQPVGRIEAIREKFYAITVEKKIKHPAALAICQQARLQLFA